MDKLMNEALLKMSKIQSLWLTMPTTGRNLVILFIITWSGAWLFGGGNSKKSSAILRAC